MTILQNLESYPISLIRQYLFCHRIPFFLESMGIKTTMPLWVKQGVKFHNKQILLQKQRTLKRFELEQGEIYYEYNLSSSGMRAHGKCDIIIESLDEVVPIEIKTSEKIYKSYILQLIGYGLLAEEKFNKPFSMGFIISGQKGKPHRIEASIELRGAFFKAWDSMVKVINGSMLPETSATALQCSQCEFINYCNDRNL